MNAYKALKEKQQQEVNAFPLMFAFTQKQFEQGMKELGLSPSDTDKIYKLGHTGGFYRKTDSNRLREMFERHEREIAEAIAQDTTGDGFIFDMFNYELSNHEYIVTGDVEETLFALGLSIDEVKKDKRLWHGLTKACKAQNG